MRLSDVLEAAHVWMETVKREKGALYGRMGRA